MNRLKLKLSQDLSRIQETLFTCLKKKLDPLRNIKVLKASWLETNLGPMLAIADEQFLYSLEFASHRGLEKKIRRFCNKINATIVPGTTEPILSIQKELKLYFEGTLQKFKTPIFSMGTPFQKRVWEELQRIPYGETCSYSDLANAIDQPSAYRAVAQANGANQFALIIPCHRVINANGNLGGYGGGLICKRALLEHEKCQKWKK